MTDRSQWADPRWCEAQYNNRLLVPNALDYIQRWPKWAAATRARLPFVTGISYGPHAREVIDIVPCPNPKGMFVFIHGGYWRVFSKDDHSWIAETFHAAGYSVALINYPLCPEVTVGTIVESCRAAIIKIWSEASPRERANMVLSGHSAGGHMAAALFATDWRARGLPESPFVGGLPISGVFELAPLVLTSMNGEMRLTADTALSWSVDTLVPQVKAPLALVVGAAESPEFVRQSMDQAARWASHGATATAYPGLNHFSIVEELRDPSSAMFARALHLFSGR